MTSEPIHSAWVLVVDKPIGPSSMTVVARARALAGGAKTGHAGTLDPRASGVLVLALGPATRAIDQLMATDKRYRTVIDLSAFTTTDDAEGERTEVPMAARPGREDIEQALRRMTGRIMQAPPAFSAVKVAGRRAYAIARGGADVKPEPREVIAHSLALIEYAWPLATIDIHCGKGFYVRSLARDLGMALGSGGTCMAIRRTTVGPFTLDEAADFLTLSHAGIREHALPLDEALARVRAHAAANAMHGG